MFFGRKQLVGLGLALVVLAGFLLAGCGGGDGTSGPLTAAQFRAQAKKICDQEVKKAEEEIEAYSAKRNLKYRTAPPPKIFEEAAEEIFIPSLERRISKLQELEGPPSEEKEVAKILAAAEEGLKNGKANLKALISGQALTEAHKLATAYGLDECF